MKVYHFRDAEFGLKSIQERRLKIARIMELNDPFEFLGVRLSNKELRRSLRETKKDLSKNTGILCFSKTWHNPVQWAHYAHNHTGICMEFEIPRKLLAKVEYVDERFPAPQELNEDFMLKLLSTKFSHWSYEKEYRLFVSLDKNEEQNGLYFKEFCENLRLTKVIVGAESSLSRKKISLALGELEKEVTVFKARPAFKSFDIIENQNKKLWA